MKRVWIAVALISSGCASTEPVSPAEMSALAGLHWNAFAPEGGLFDRADFDRDGRLSEDETRRSIPRLANRFRDADANRDGYLTYKEACQHLGVHRWETLEDRL